jgi:hypothetical protein
MRTLSSSVSAKEENVVSQIPCYRTFHSQPEKQSPIAVQKLNQTHFTLNFVSDIKGRT